MKKYIVVKVFFLSYCSVLQERNHKAVYCCGYYNEKNFVSKKLGAIFTSML
jgi:hypothetical protein